MLTSKKKRVLGLQIRLILLIVIATITVVVSGYWTFHSFQQIELVSAQHREFTRKIDELKSGFADRHLLLTDLRKADSPEEFDQIAFKIKGAEQTLTPILRGLPASTGSSYPSLELNRYVESYQAGISGYIDTLKSNNKVSADRIASTSLSPDFAKILQHLSSYQTEYNKQIAGQNATLESKINSIRFWSFFVVLLSLLVVGIIPYLLFGERFRLVSRINRVLEKLKSGEIAKIEVPETTDEIGQLATGINQVSENLDKAASFANDVGQGKFDTEFHVSGDGDVLGAALVEMRDRLKAVALDESQRNWAIAGYAQISEILSSNADLQTFADAIISRLTQYIGANQGGFFIAQENTDSGQTKFELVMLSAYAYDRKKYISKTFQLGEGFVGQAALEKGTLYLRDIPANYMTITSGLGEAVPASLLVVPLISGNEMYGVLEFASFQPIDLYKIEFVERLAENIAVTLTSVRNNERNLRLLRESQQMAQQLTANEEEMRQNMEELSATQEEMKRVQVELAGQVSAMNNAAIVSEADLKGDILFVNDEFCRIAKYRREELIGRNHRILKSGHQPQEIFDDLWKTISRGMVWRGVIKNRAKDGSYYWVSSTITPILNIEGKPVKYVGVRFDITDQVAQSEQIQTALEQAQSQEEEIRQNAEELVATQEEMKRINVEMQGNLSAINKALSVVEFDLNGNLIKANNNFLRLMGYEYSQVEGRHHSLFVEKEFANSTEYKDFWIRLRNGESFDQEFIRVNSAGKLVYIRGYYFPVLDKEGHPYKIMKFAVDITKIKEQEILIQQTLEETQSQEEEIRQNAEELVATQEEMKRINMEMQGNLSAINKALSVVEFDLNGNLLKANNNFLRLMGYEYSEVEGRHHSIFVEKEFADSMEYKDFWVRLRNSESFDQEFTRVNSVGKLIYIRGYYFPVLDKEGHPYKIMKFAVDITKMKEQEMLIQQTLEETKAQEEEIRQNAEELLSTQEEMRRVQVELNGQISALNNAAIVSEADLRGDIIFVNDEFCRIAKYNKEELIGNNHRMLKSGHQEQSIFEDLWRTISKGQVWRGVIKNKAKDGTFYWVSSTITPILDLEGKPVKYVGVRFDITSQVAQQEQIQIALEEAKAQEEEIRQNAEELLSTQEEMRRVQVELDGQISALNNAAIVSEADLKGDIIFANDEFCRIAKYNRNELLGQNHRMLKSGHQEQSIFEDLWHKISRGQVWRGVIKNKAKDGTYYWVSSTITPILSQDGKPIKYVGVRFDITAQIEQSEQIKVTLEETQAQEEEIRQTAEELLATQEDMKRVQVELNGQVAALNNAAIVSEADIKGDIIFVNDEFCRIAKYSRIELLGQNHRILKSGHQPDVIFDDLWRTISRGMVWRGIIKNKARDGSYYWVASTITPIMGMEGKPVKYVAVRFDITDQVAQSEQVKDTLTKSKSVEEESRQREESLKKHVEELTQAYRELSDKMKSGNGSVSNELSLLKGQIDKINDSTGYVELNHEGFVTAVSSLMLNLLGFESYDLIGLHLKDVVKSDQNGLLVFLESNGNGSKQQYQSKLAWKTKSGHWIELPATLNKVPDSTGSTAKIVTLVHLQNGI